MKYKVGDIVKVKSIGWYNRNKDEDGVVNIWPNFTIGMSKYCGKKVKIERVMGDSETYLIEGNWCTWIDEFFEGKSNRLELE